jgi:hypothetical protein
MVGTCYTKSSVLMADPGLYLRFIPLTKWKLIYVLAKVVQSLVQMARSNGEQLRECLYWSKK